MNVSCPQFFEKIKNSKKILVLDLGFLGDTIHLLPALNCIVEALPDAQVDVMVADHIRSILELTPWVGEVLGYPRFPKGPKWYEDFGRIGDLRKRGYDCVINVNGSDRSSILTWACRAKHRLGRIPLKHSFFWKHCFTDRVFEEFKTKPFYQQRYNCLLKAGFPDVGVAFNTQVPEAVEKKIDTLLEGQRDFIHISPFATLDYKELPEDLLAEFINGLTLKYPEKKIVLSCAPNDREKNKLTSLLGKFKNPVWKIFAGELSLVELAAVMGRASIHLGADSGALHVAMMMGTRTFSWFREYDGMYEWLPTGEGHSHIIGKASERGLVGIDLEQLLEKAKI